MKFYGALCVIIFLLIVISSSAQNNRLADHNAIGWYGNFATFKLNDRFSIHAEYQWRRADIITNWQQSLLRTGINYRVNPRVLFRLGYAWVETYAYGDIPINGLGRSFTEHRLFEMAQLNHKEGRFDLSHRFMLEQRLVGRYSTAAVSKEDEYPLLHRVRYMFRMQTSLKGKEIKDRTPYFAFYDEVMIGFGKNVNANVFDQNRIGLLFGYQFNNKLRIEGGFLNQTVQFGRLVNNRNVFQYNNGIIINANYNIDLTGSKKK